MTGEKMRLFLRTGVRRGAGSVKAGLLAAGVIVAGLPCLAASYTNSATGNWDADASWTGSKPAAGGASDAVIVFNPPGVDVSTNNLSGTFSLSRLEFASGRVTLAGGALGFSAGGLVTNASGSPALIRNAVTLSGETTFGGAAAVTNAGIISGVGSIVKTGAGALVLTTNNTYTGATTVSGGQLTIVTATTVTSMQSTNFTVQGGATMRVLSGAPNAWSTPDKSVFNVQSNGTLTIDVPTIHCGFLTAENGATVNGTAACMSLHATNTASSGVASLGGVAVKKLILEPYNAVNPSQTVRYDGSGSGLSVGTDSGTPFSWRVGSGSTGRMTYRLDVADSPSAAVDMLVPFLNLRPSSGGFTCVKQGGGALQINGMDWTSAPTPNAPFACFVSGGTLVLNTSAANALGVNFSGVTVDSGATLQVGAGSTSGAVYVSVTNNGTLAFNRSDAVTFTNLVTGSGAVVQMGPGALTLSGANQYSGGTVVSGGTLLVAGSGAPTGSGAVTVTGGTLGGSGTVSGTVAAGAGCALMPGGSNAVGTLTLANAGADALTLNGSRVLVDLSNVAGTCDQIAVSGGLVLNGASTLALSFPSGTPPAGVYTLMTYASKSGAGTLALNTRYPNATLTVGETSVTLTVVGSGITYLKWNGNVSGTWDTTSANWLKDGAASVYSEGDAVIFDDSASGNFSVGGGAVSPATVTFNNSAGGSASNYTVSASIGGGGTALFALGSGTVTLSGVNTYSGGTTLGGGTLTVSAYTNLPTEGGLVFSGGSLRVLGTSITSLNPYTVNWDSFNGGLNIGSSANTFTVTNAIGGPGSLSKTGAGVLALTAANSYVGGTAVGGGIVRISASEALGSGAVSMAVGSELDLLGGLSVSNAITVYGVGFVNSAGSLQSANGSFNTWSGPVTLGENQARLGAVGGTLQVTGVIGSGSNKFDLVVRNPNEAGGTLLLANNNTWQGNTWIRCGTIKLGVSDALPVTTVLQLGLNAAQTGVTNSTFDLAGFSQRVAGLTDVGTDNLHVVTNSASAVATLTVSNTTACAYAGSLAGNLNLVKIGSGIQTLSGASDCGGSVVVSNGTLAVGSAGSLGLSCTNIVVAGGTLALSNSACLANAACVRIADGGGAKVSLAAGVNEAVGTLFFGDKRKAGGTYGGTGSGADVIDPEHFAGTGILSVLYGGGTLITVR